MTSNNQRPMFGGLWLKVIAGAALALHLVTFQPALRAQAKGEYWVGTWAAALVERPEAPAPQWNAARGQGPAPAAAPAPQGPPPISQFNNQTLRQIVHVSLGGERIRVVLSNVFGTAPLMIGAAHVALRDKDAAIVAKSDRPLMFSGSSAITIPAMSMVVSDPVSLSVPALTDLAVDIYIPGDTMAEKSPFTTHAAAQQTNYVSRTGNHAGTPDLPVAQTTQAWFFLARVEVMAPEPTGAIATVGDSITDGAGSTRDTNNRWPDHLARRLTAQKIKMGVLNVGINGNRLLLDGNGVSALARFDRDVLVQTGVTHVIIFEGVNDIRRTTAPVVSAADLIMAHKQIVERAHARRLKVIGAFIAPFEGSLWTPENEAKRQAVNDWIRNGKGYDAFIDFDAALRDPSHPTRLNPKFDSGDNIHPNDAGYQAMAAAIDLALFKMGQRTSTN